MVHLDWEQHRHEGVTFVSATVANDRSTPQTVVLESRLDGPTWPSRGDGSALEWNEDRWIGTVGPGRRRGVGFASPAATAEPPLELVDASRAAECDELTLDETLADLEDWKPPREVLDRRP